MRYVSREQAARHAHRNGIQAFSCHYRVEGMAITWEYRVEIANNTLKDALHWAKNKDFVSHVEMHDNEAVLIVTCFREDFADMVVPFKVAPLTPSLWQNREEQIKAGLRSKDDGSRERSAVQSPVALAFETYDEAPHLPKNELVARAMERGVTKNTANAQYYRWKAARNL